MTSGLQYHTEKERAVAKLELNSMGEREVHLVHVKTVSLHFLCPNNVQMKEAALVFDQGSVSEDFEDVITEAFSLNHLLPQTYTSKKDRTDLIVSYFGRKLNRGTSNFSWINQKYLIVEKQLREFGRNFYLFFFP